MTHSDLITFFLALGILLGTARLLGEIARKLQQPAVLGELLAGIILGPTLFGNLMPDTFQAIFPTSPGFTIAIQGLSTLAITLFLLVAGIEVDLSTILRKGRVALSVSLGGILVPFALTFGASWLGIWLVPNESLGRTPHGSDLVFALFMATALSITALPVIAKTLMDLGLYRSDFGMTVIAAAVLNDLVGWIIFAALLTMMGSPHTTNAEKIPLGWAIGLTLSFTLGMLTVGRWLFHRTLPFIQAHASWPGGVLGFAICIALLGGAFTEWIGIHAIFGAFIVGVALGDSAHLKERTRQTLDNFVTFIFAPIFFVTIGLKVNFIANFDPILTLFVLTIACVGKFFGCAYAARWSGIPWRESWAIGSAMNARGTMEIILALLAKEAGLITDRLFVALVIMALVTSVATGPLIQRILRRQKPIRFTQFLGSRSFLARLDHADRFSALEKLCRASGVPEASLTAVIDAVQAREVVLASGIGNGVALSHVSLPGLTKSHVALGISRKGIDFDSGDGQPCHIVCLILTPENDYSIGLELYRDAASTLRKKNLYEKAIALNTYTEFLALLAEFDGHGQAPAVQKSDENQRTGTLVIGATPLARALAKLLEKFQSVTLIDSNPAHIAEATKDGLHAVVGNALDVEALATANAGSAEFTLAMTTNPNINILASRQLREVFKIPQIAIALEQSAGETNLAALKSLGAQLLLGHTVRLSDWDHWFSNDMVAIHQIQVPAGFSGDAATLASPDIDTVILAVERMAGGRLFRLPYTREYQAQDGDILLMGQVRAPQQPTRDWFDDLLRNCPIYDLERALQQDELFSMASTALASSTNQAASTIAGSLYSREAMSSTILTPGLAIPHVILEGQAKFAALVYRSLPGVQFEGHPEPVHAIFVLAASPDERNFHLKALAAIAQIWQSPQFEAQWRTARNAESLRQLLLNAPRQRQK